MSGKGFLDNLLDIASGHKRIIVVGRVDTGKSTLIRNMADHMDAYVLDADIGQNDIGPPSVVSIGERVDGQYKAIDGYFCGSTSPSGHFMQMISGVSRLIQPCGKHKVLINTTGLATGDIGRVLKTEKINATRADLIIGLETKGELQYLNAFGKAGAEVVIFKPHPHVTSRSRTARAEIRAASFRKYFDNAMVTEHKLDKIGVERSLLCNGRRVDSTALDGFRETNIKYAEVLDEEALLVYGGTIEDREKIASMLDADTIYAYRPADFSGALTGLIDKSGKLSALGLIESIDFKAGTIRLFSTVKDFSVLQFGSMRLNRENYNSAGPFRPEVLRTGKDCIQKH